MPTSSVIRPTSPEVVNTFLRDGLDVAAGVTQQLEAYAKRLGGLRLLEGSFMVIRQAMGIAKPRGAGAAEWLNIFIRDILRNGFVTTAVQRHSVDGVSIPA